MNEYNQEQIVSEIAELLNSKIIKHYTEGTGGG
jgi:hypothetical protein